MPRTLQQMQKLYILTLIAAEINKNVKADASIIGDAKEILKKIKCKVR